MTKRERVVRAFGGGVPDRVPFAPDAATMVPIKLTGKPFYEVLYRGNPPLWKAYIDFLDYYDVEGWFNYSIINWKCDGEPVQWRSWEDKDEYGRLMVVTEMDTPRGTLRQRAVYPDYDCETLVEKWIKSFREDFPKFKYYFRNPVGCDLATYREQCRAVGDRAAIGVGASTPGLNNFIGFFNGNMEAITYAYYDEPELFMELCEMYGNNTLKYLEMLLEITPKPDYVLTCGSGTITLQSPEIFDELTLPWLKKITRMCKEAGVLSVAHSCGKEMHLLKRGAEETDLNCVNPMEIPPMGDCDMKTAKRLYGHKLCLMGNLHTTDVMLNGTPNLVRLKSLEAIRDAGENGGFVLSTGDQIGRDTPEANIRMMVQVCKEFGEYPLDMDAINAEIRRLEKLLEKKQEVPD